MDFVFFSRLVLTVILKNSTSLFFFAIDFKHIKKFILFLFCRLAKNSHL